MLLETANTSPSLYSDEPHCALSKILELNLLMDVAARSKSEIPLMNMPNSFIA